MERIIRFLLLASITLPVLFSCTREIEPSLPALAPDPQSIVISATCESDGPATKTELVGESTYWSVGDKISVFFGSGTDGGAEFTSLNTEPSASADFTGILTAVTGSENGSSSTKYFWGVYPYSVNNSVTLSGSSNYLTTVVNDVQYGVAGSYSAGQNIWIGRNLGLELSFKSLLSGIRFTFSRDDILAVTIQGNNGEYLAGKVNVVMDSGVPVVSEVVEGKTVLTLKPDGGGAFSTGAVYRALFLPTNFTSGLTVKFYTSGGVVGTRSYGSLNFERNKPKNANNADATNTTWEYDYVEMAEGFRWARRNIGAYSPEGYGDYFAWGETEPKSSYTGSNYDYSLPFSDAATANWGDGWRTPTAEEFDALLNTTNYTWEWTTENGVNGYRVTSKVPGYAGNSIFLPDAGYSLGLEAQACGYYWSSSLSATDSREAKELFLYSSSRMTLDEYRYWGNTIRAIFDPSTTSHEYVELGDGVRWATTNVGADNPEEFGDYFSWGETAPKSEYSFGTYAWMQSGHADWNYYTKYQVEDGMTDGIWYSGDTFIGDGKSTLDASDDAAAANWGADWHMPTVDEWTWLVEHCSWSYESQNGVSGYRITSNESGYTSNSIFLPTAGFKSGTYSNLGTGEYWSSSLSTYTDCAMGFGFTSSSTGTARDGRFYGRPVRPVYGALPEVSVTGVSFDMENYAVLNGGTSALTASISPADASNKALTWTSSNPSVAIVGATGVVTGKKVGTTTITARTVDGGFTATCTVTVITNASYVDMGNGTRWATRNVGADSPEGHGGYYAWGETGTKSSYSWTNYQHGSSSSNLSKYNSTDGKTVLDPEDDAATANWGDAWRMPTDDEFMWLKDNCTWTWAKMNGVKGRVVMSNIPGYDSAIIFIPATGYYDGESLKVASSGCYWSATGSSSARYFLISATTYNHTNNQRCYGLAVRPVYDPQQFINGHEYVEMGDGLKWATCNVGANAPEAYGDYFAWGETTTKSNYSWSTYFDNPSGDGETFTKYAKDKKTVLDLTDDAARQNWGSTWRMPTEAEWAALLNADNFDWRWTDNHEGTGVAGRIVTSKVEGYEGNSIFLPAAGYWYNTSLFDAGSYGYYCSSSLYTNYSPIAWIVYFHSSQIFHDKNHFRYSGRSVRPVSE